MKKKKLQSPFIPPAQDNFDQKNINEEWKDIHDESFQANVLALTLPETQEVFSGYFYDKAVSNLLS